MANTVLRGTVKILGPLPDGTGHKFLTVNPTTGEVGQVDTPLSSVTGDISINGAGVSSINPSVIVNADINASAGIAHSKMAALSASRVMVTDSSGFATTGFSVSILNFSANLTSDAQAQINNKQATIIGAASTIVSSNLTPDRAVVAGAGGKIEVHPSTTLTEIGYVNGVTSPIQTQLNARLSVTLTSVAQGDIIYFDGSNWVNFPRGTNGQFLSSTGATIQWASVSTLGVPVGGTAGQALTKIDGTDYNTQWTTITLATLGVSASIAEVDLLIGAGANIQTQLNNKLSSALTTDNLWVGVAGVATPTTNLPTGTTIGSAVIYRVGGTDVTPADGGTGISSYAVGDLLYASGTTTLSKLAVGTNGHVLTLSGGLPVWSAAAGGIGGSTGSTDNALLRADGTGGATVQSSGVILSDTANITLGVSSLAGANRSIGVNGSASNIELQLSSNGTSGIGLYPGGFLIASFTPTGAGTSDIVNVYDLRRTPSGGGASSNGYGLTETRTLRTTSATQEVGKFSYNWVDATNAAVVGKIIFSVGAGNTYFDYLSVQASSSTSGNLALLTNTGSFGGGQRVVFVNNATTVPSSNPSGGALFFASGGRLYGQTSISYAMGGVIFTSTTTTGNVTTGEDTLFTTSIPANTLNSNKDTLVATCAGTFGASINNKRIRVRFGSTLIFDSGALAITAATSWVVELEIIRTGAATQKCNVRLNTSSAALSAYANYTVSTETLSNANNLDVTGEGTATNDIVGEMFKVRWEAAEG